MAISEQTPPRTLIVGHDAADYLAVLRARLGHEARLDALTDENQQPNSSQRQSSIVMGPPDQLAALLPQLPDVKWLQSTWAGVTPLVNQPRRDFQLTGIQGVFGAQMAEYVFAWLLEAAVRLPQRREAQQEKRWMTEPSASLEGQTLGVLGTGSIGAHIAGVGAALGMRVLGLNSDGRKVPGFDQLFAPRDLHDLLGRCDAVVSVLPDTGQSRGLLDRAAFGAMRPGSTLLNVGRGSVIDESALVEAVMQGQPTSAVLDVFSTEPLPPESAMWTTPGITVTGHIAAISRPTDIANVFIRNYRRFTAGEPLLYRVDFDRGY